MTEPAPGTAMALAPTQIPTLMGPPSLDEWDLLERQAATLAQSKLIPRAYQGKPQEIIVAALWAREMRLPLMQTFAKLHIIEGTPSMAAELMVAVIKRDGHKFRPLEVTAWSATAFGQRKDSEQSVEFTFDLEDALGAGLLDVWWERWIGDDGGRNRKVTWVLPRHFTRVLRPDDIVVVPDDAPDWVHNLGPAGAKRKDNWWGYPKSMLWARAASQLARMEFGDVLMGVTLTPEELGAEIDPLTGEITDRDVLAPSQVIAEFGARLEALKARAGQDPKVRVHVEALRAWFVEWKVPPITRLPSRFVGAVDEQIAAIEQWLVVDATASDPAGRHHFQGPDSGNECATCGLARADAGHFPDTRPPPAPPVDAATLCAGCGHPWDVHDGDGCGHVEHGLKDDVGCGCTEPGPGKPSGAIVPNNLPATPTGDPTGQDAPAPPPDAVQPPGPGGGHIAPARPADAQDGPDDVETDDDVIDAEAGDGPYRLQLANDTTVDPIVVELAPLERDESAPSWACTSDVVPEEGDYVRCPDSLTRQVVAVWDAEPTDVARNYTAPDPVGEDGAAFV